MRRESPSFPSPNPKGGADSSFSVRRELKGGGAGHLAVGETVGHTSLRPRLSFDDEDLHRLIYSFSEYADFCGLQSTGARHDGSGVRGGLSGTD